MVCLDTNILAYFVEQNKEFYRAVQKELRSLKAAKEQACITFLTLAELLVRPIKEGDGGLIDFYHQIENNLPVKIIYPDEQSILTTAKLRAKYGIKMPDAINIATALACKCNTFLTNDAALKKVSEIRIKPLA